MFRKSGFVAAVLTAGLVLGAPLASASTSDDPPPKDEDGSSQVDNRGCKAGSGILNISCNPIGVNVGPLL